MPVTAIKYDIKDGCEDDIAEIFGSFRRVGTPVIRNADGAETGRILSTALFISGDTMVRFITYEGDVDDVARFMAGQPGVQEVERKLVPFLASPRDTGTVEGFVETFKNSTMRCLSALSA
ncbi:SchA/CurD-like domain-containing protein [Amycolatopsis sp. NPDC021455]|uniref:SchA/CurD-like domain-containing protein n=1 Tax=Amycolatopsis sp. NPDC021455 TaxID=3154901 RepID=UPI0034075676